MRLVNLLIKHENDLRMRCGDLYEIIGKLYSSNEGWHGSMPLNRHLYIENIQCHELNILVAHTTNITWLIDGNLHNNDRITVLQDRAPGYQHIHDAKQVLKRRYTRSPFNHRRLLPLLYACLAIGQYPSFPWYYRSITKAPRKHGSNKRLYFGMAQIKQILEFGMSN